MKKIPQRIIPLDKTVGINSFEESELTISAWSPLREYMAPSGVVRVERPPSECSLPANDRFMDLDRIDCLDWWILMRVPAGREG